MSKSTESQTPTTALASWEIETADLDGVVKTESKFLYFEGRPREYRFNGQTGQFNLYGDRVLMDNSGRMLSVLSFQPIAYRIFEDCLFGRAVRELWAELFFVDKDSAVGSIMFSNTSVNELYRLLEPILYEKKSLCDVVLTVKPERVQSKNDPNKSWFIARFSYEDAKPELIQMYRDFVKHIRIYRGETLTVSAEHKLISHGYYMAINPMDDYRPEQTES